MRWVLITALGWPVEPEVNRNLAMVSGVTLACAAATSASSSAPSRSANMVVLRPGGGLRATTNSVPSGTAAAIARANASPLLANTSPGVSKSMMAFNLPKSPDISE